MSAPIFFTGWTHWTEDGYGRSGSWETSVHTDEGYYLTEEPAQAECDRLNSSMRDEYARHAASLAESNATYELAVARSAERYETELRHAEILRAAGEDVPEPKKPRNQGGPALIPTFEEWRERGHRPLYEVVIIHPVK